MRMDIELGFIVRQRRGVRMSRLAAKSAQNTLVIHVALLLLKPVPKRHVTSHVPQATSNPTARTATPAQRITKREDKPAGVPVAFSGAQDGSSRGGGSVRNASAAAALITAAVKKAPMVPAEVMLAAA
jgi:hypothetical protein